MSTMDREELREMRFLAMDIKLFLRLASDHFPNTKDREVLQKLVELADQWAAGMNIWKKESADD